MKKITKFIPNSFYAILPFCLGVILVFVAVLPLRLPVVDAPFGPFVVLTIIYPTAVKYPSLLPAIGVFVLGILYDMLSSGPLGYWALIYLCAFMLSKGQKYLVGREQLLASWIAFAFITSLSGLFSWGVGSLLFGQLASYKETLIGVLTACLLYPFVYGLLIPVDRRFFTTKIQGFGRA